MQIFEKCFVLNIHRDSRVMMNDDAQAVESGSSIPSFCSSFPVLTHSGPVRVVRIYLPSSKDSKLTDSFEAQRKVKDVVENRPSKRK